MVSSTACPGAKPSIIISELTVRVEFTAGVGMITVSDEKPPVAKFSVCCCVYPYRLIVSPTHIVLVLACVLLKVGLGATLTFWLSKLVFLQPCTSVISNCTL